jgi:DNA-binding LytR/AlgR family response regulator
VGSSVYVIPVEDVVYFEAADKYVRIITIDKDGAQPEKLIRTPLRELLPRLDQSLFWQIHRSHVVNVRAIERVSRQHQRLRMHLRGRQETLDISRMYSHLFKAM